MDRSLTPKGERQAQRVAQWLNQRLPESTRILVSPALRTQQTAQALGRKFRTVEAIAPDAPAQAVLDAVRWPDRARPRAGGGPSAHAGPGAVAPAGRRPARGPGGAQGRRVVAAFASARGRRAPAGGGGDGAGVRLRCGHPAPESTGATRQAGAQPPWGGPAPAEPAGRADLLGDNVPDDRCADPHPPGRLAPAPARRRCPGRRGAPYGTAVCPGHRDAQPAPRPSPPRWPRSLTASASKPPCRRARASSP